MKPFFHFTLVALGITGVLAGVFWYIDSGSFVTTKEQRVRRDISTLTPGLQAYKMNAGMFPNTEQGLDALVHEPTVEPLPKRWNPYLKKQLTDGWLREYQYRQPGVHNPDSFDIWSLGQDGIPSDDDIGNWEQ